MPKVSGLTAKERALAERIGNGKIPKSGKLSDALAIGVGFVIARRADPTLDLRTYELGHTADQVRASLDDQPTPRRAASDADDDG